MVQHTRIESDDASIELCILTDRNGNWSHDMIWITFNELNDENYPDMKLSWDNSDFIFIKFYKFLHRWKNKTLKRKDRANYDDIWIILTDERVEEIIDMIDSAINQGWYIREVTVKF
jgi:hypothetical protein